jgi:hypothetical protein
MDQTGIILLVKKRHAELECLGIPAQLYYKAVKLIDRHAYIVVKANTVYIFKKPEFDLHDTKSKSKYYDSDKIVQILTETFGVDKTVGFTIYSEWLREKVIYTKMTQDSTKYWDFLCLPTTYSEIEIDEEFNF